MRRRSPPNAIVPASSLADKPRLAVLIVLLGLTAACGARFYEPPSAAGVPATDGQLVLDQATKACRGVTTFQAAMRLSGRRLPSLNVSAGVTADGRIRLLVGATTAPDLWLAGTADAATLLLRDGNRVVHARAEEIVDALIGIRVGPERFLALIDGCVARDLTISRAIAYNGTRRITTPNADLFVEQIGAEWRVVAGAFGDVRVDYRPVSAPFPRRIAIRAVLPDGRGEARLTLDVQESLIDRPIQDGAFRLDPPPGASPMTLDELRRQFSGR